MDSPERDAPAGARDDAATALHPATVLKRAPEVSVRLRSNNQVEMSVGEVWARTGLHGLAVLETFSQAMPFSAGLERLTARSSGTMDFIELTSTIVGLAKTGILQDQATARPTLAKSRRQFDSAWIHVAMLNDRVRTESYLAAIRDVVRPGDVVVDVGTGTGVLAIAAAQAGARHVYAIEASSIGQVAKTLFDANGVADRITLLEGHSTRVELPERADVMVSEIIGSDPLGEQVLEVTRDAATRLLKPDARLIPSAFSLYGLPVEAPDEAVQKATFTPGALENWRTWYGIDFAPLAGIAGRSPYRMLVRPDKLKDYAMLGAPVALVQREFRKKEPPAVEETRRVAVTRDGRLNGIALFFELALSPSVLLSTDPAKARPDNHWHHAVWMLPEPIAVRAGDELDITYRHRVDGNGVDVVKREAGSGKREALGARR